MFIEQLKQEGYTVYVVRGKLPQPLDLGGDGYGKWVDLWPQNSGGGDQDLERAIGETKAN